MVQDRAIGLLTVANKKAEIPPSRIGSGVWVNTDFKKNSRLVGRLGSGPRFVGRLTPGVRISASF